MSIADDFAKMIAEGQRQQRLIAAFPGLEKARKMSIPELRALWDSIDDSGSMATSDPEIDGDTVHFVLNEKGDVAYCAV
jgi:hypothetical protein